MFERFRQADSSTTRAHSGVGLGLAIARHLVEQHAGTIDAHSDGPDKGAMFTVRFPRLFSSTQPAAVAVRRPDMGVVLPVVPNGHTFTVWIADGVPTHSAHASGHPQAHDLR